MHYLHVGLAVVYRPDGREVAVATLNGHITMFDVQTTDETGCIEGQKDLKIKKSEIDIISDRNSYGK